ncbi:magnesium-chelatase subunit ChlI, chloroplastic [Tanacetum coccineum]
MSLKWGHKSNGDTVNNRSDDANILSTAIESFTKVEHIEDEEMEFTCHLDQIPLVCDFHLKRFDREEWSLASEALVSVDLLKDSFMSWVLILNVSCDVERLAYGAKAERYPLRVARNMLKIQLKVDSISSVVVKNKLKKGTSRLLANASGLCEQIRANDVEIQCRESTNFDLEGNNFKRTFLEFLRFAAASDTRLMVRFVPKNSTYEMNFIVVSIVTGCDMRFSARWRGDLLQLQLCPTQEQVGIGVPLRKGRSHLTISNVATEISPTQEQPACLIYIYKKINANVSRVLLSMNSRLKSCQRKTRDQFISFAAIVGQDEMKLCLLLNVIDPKIGGVMIMGDRGTGKSTTVRSLVDLLPEITVVAADPFNSNPEDP